MNLAPMLLGCALSLTSPVAPVLQVANQGIRIEANTAGMPVEELLDLVAKVTGRPVTWSPQNAAVIQGKVVRLNHAIEVPRDRFVAFAMGLLRVHDLVLVSWGPMGAEYWLVDSLTSSALLQEAARHIPLERLPEYRERYELISVTVPIRNMPLDRAQSCVQRLQRQGQGARMVPFRATNSLLITDLGPCAVSLVELIQAMDDDSGMPALPEPKACDPGRTRR